MQSSLNHNISIEQRQKNPAGGQKYFPGLRPLQDTMTLFSCGSRRTEIVSMKHETKMNAPAKNVTRDLFNQNCHTTTRTDVNSHLMGSAVLDPCHSLRRK